MLKGKVKVGDKVRVRTDLVEGMKIGDWLITRGMALCAGKEVTIREIHGDGIMEMNETGFFTGWIREMLEDIQTNKVIRIIVNGNTTIAKMDDKQGIAICNPSCDTFDEKEGTRIAVCRLLGIDPFEKHEDVVVKDSLDRFSIEEILMEIIKRVE